MQVKEKPQPKRQINRSDEYQITLPVINKKLKMAQLDYLATISKR